VSVVAPSDGGGAIESEAAVAGESAPPELPTADAAEVVAEMLGAESDPATISGWPAVVVAVEIVVGASGAVALTSNVGAADAVEASVAVVVVVTTAVGTLTVWGVSVVVVVDTTVVCVESVTVCAGSATDVVGDDWMLVAAAAELIGALLDVPIRAGATVGVLAAGAGAPLDAGVEAGALLGAGCEGCDWDEAPCEGAAAEPSDEAGESVVDESVVVVAGAGVDGSPGAALALVVAGADAAAVVDSESVVAAESVLAESEVAVAAELVLESLAVLAARRIEDEDGDAGIGGVGGAGLVTTGALATAWASAFAAAEPGRLCEGLALWLGGTVE